MLIVQIYVDNIIFHFRNIELCWKFVICQHKRRYRVAQMSLPLPDGTQPPSVDVNVIYLEVYEGINKNNRIFGIDSLYTSQLLSPWSPSWHSCGTYSHGQQLDELRVQFQAHRLEIEVGCSNKWGTNMSPWTWELI